MGYVHFVRSPHAHAKIVSIDVAAALALDGVYGTLTGDEVAIQTDPFFEMSIAAGERDQGLRARGRQGAVHGRAGRGRLRDARASWRATPPSWSRSSTSRYRVLDDGRGGAEERDGSPRGRRLDVGLAGASSTGANGRARRQRPTTSSRSSSGASTASRPRRSSAPAPSSSTKPRHRPVDDALQPPDAGSGRMPIAQRSEPASTSSASSRRTSAARSATRSASTRNSWRCVSSRGN